MRSWSKVAALMLAFTVLLQDVFFGSIEFRVGDAVPAETLGASAWS
jgi:hypothetical protein